MEILSCAVCQMMAFRPMEESPITEVPQTRDRRRDCGFVHGWEIVGDVDARAFVHLALSTVLRYADITDWYRDAIHHTQQQMSAQDLYRRHGWPQRLMDGHDVTSDGLVVARLMAKWCAGQEVHPRNSLTWRSAAGLLGVTL